MRTPKLLSAGLLAAALAAPPALSQPSAKPVPLTPAMSRTLDGIFQCTNRSLDLVIGICQTLPGQYCGELSRAILQPVGITPREQKVSP